MSPLLSIAHRGYSARFPENTRLAFEGAIDAGADYIEVDARLSADSQVICCHDADLTRLAGDPLKIATTRSDHIQSFDLGKGQRILGLTEVLRMATGRIGVLIDMKTKDDDLIQAVIACVLATDSLATTVFGLRSLDQTQWLERLRTKAQYLGFVDNYLQIQEFFKRGARAVRVWEEDLEHPQVRQAFENGYPLWVMAGFRHQGENVGYITPARLNRLRRIGVEAVLLNDPSLITKTTTEK